ncbi:M23 family metallopeptidase [Streptomyces sp. URMC 129]|uniref:M23 family metallopeptidase n=1 Tax=Streptomyces sp. URMC 129 TaxID=3423407 RepID=UPI003F1A9FD5
MSARGRHRRLRARRSSRISLMLTAGGAGVALPLIAAGGASAAQPAAQQVAAANAAPAGSDRDSDRSDRSDRERSDRESGTRTYTVVKGDSLFKIADAQDVEGGWEQLYEDNRQVIGGDPHLIHPGQELSLDGTAAAQTAAPEPEPAPAPSDETGTGYTAPTSGAVGTNYAVAGSNWSSGYHTGVDFPVPTGTPVVAITSGEVVTARTSSAYGNEVVIKHADGHYSQYAHLSSFSVTVGQTVGTGEQIGTVGATGNATGPHLHFEVRTGPEYGSDIDPLAYLRSFGVAL